MRPRTILLATLAGGLVAVPAASAHVTMSIDTIQPGGFAYFNVQVPNERPNAATTEVSVRVPAGLFFVQVQPMPGWQVKMTKTKLAKPVTLFGTKVSERVSRITWSGGRIAPDEFQMFGMSALFPKVRTTLKFPSLQKYSNGETVRWIGPPSAELPAPTVKVAGRVASE